MAIDPKTGLPELPEGYVWKVYRNSKIRILRNGFRTGYSKDLPEDFNEESIRAKADYLADAFYWDLEKSKKPKSERVVDKKKDYNLYLDDYKDKLLPLGVGYRWRLERRYNGRYFYLSIVKETGFVPKKIFSTAIYLYSFLPVIFDTYQEAVKVFPEIDDEVLDPESYFTEQARNHRNTRYDLRGYYRIHNKYRMIVNDFKVLGTFGVEGYPELRYTVSLTDKKDCSLDIDLHGKILPKGSTSQYPDYTSMALNTEVLDRDIQRSVKYLIREIESKKESKQLKKKLSGKYPPKTLTKDL